MRAHLGAATAALLLIGSACSTSFAKDNPQLCSDARIQAVKDAVAKDGLTLQQAADKAGTDARCLSDDETKRAQATFAAFKARPASTTAAPTLAPTGAPATAAPTLSPSASPSVSASASPSATANQTTAPSDEPTPVPTQVTTTAAPTLAATPSPTATPTMSPSPSPSPTQTAAAGDGGWPTVVSHPIQSNEKPISGHIAHANGTAASHYCVILTSGPCAVTSDANGNFTTSFLPSIPVNLVIKGQFNGGDGPVVATASVTAGTGPISITVP